MKKICFIVSQPGSAVSFLKEHINKMSSDFEIHLVANIKDEAPLKNLKLTTYKSIPIERRPNVFTDLKALYLLYKYFKNEEFFAVHSVTRKAGLLTAIAGAFAKIPHRIQIFTGQVWCDMIGFKRLFYKLLDKLVVSLNTELLVDGFSQKNYLVEQKIIKPNDAVVLANGSICGVNVSRFAPSEETRRINREKLNFKPENIVFVFLGRLKTDKGINELLAAHNKIVEKNANAVLLLIGPDEENCKSRMVDYPQLKENENIIFYGFTAEPEKLLQSGDVFCLPTYREGFGMSVLEASCLGLPVICSDTYGVLDAMVDDVTGLRCKVKDVDSLVECMDKLMLDKDLRLELGSNGRNRVLKEFNADIVTDAWLEYYKNLK